MTPDPAALAAIHRAAFTFPRPWSAAEIAALLADPHCFALAGADGFAIGRAVAGEAELLTIAVLPDARGRGRGTALLADLLRAASGRGATRIFLEVAATNHAAIRLYERAGFSACGRRRGYFRDDQSAVDALVLARDLGAGSGGQRTGTVSP